MFGKSTFAQLIIKIPPILRETSRSLLSADQSAVGTHSEAEGSDIGKVRPVAGYEGRDGNKLYSFFKLDARWIG
jgi:hypothetical protein